MCGHRKGICRFSLLVIMTFLSLGLLAACGSSGGGGGSSEVRSLGEIQALGSIVVNGVKYETEGAQIIGLDNPNEDLKEGRMVLVDGRVNDDGKTGRANRIKVEDSVKGPLTSITGDDSVKTGVIMGQPVIFEDNITKFDPATGLPLGDDLNKVFVVSGFVRDDGKIQASFARKISDDDFSNFLAQGGILEVKGTVSNLTAQTFNINGLVVDYSAATLRNLPAGGLAEGLLVEVKGNDFDAANQTLTATEIEGKARGLGDDVAKAEIEGFIADLNGNTFFVNGQEVLISDRTTYRAGLPEELIDGIKVEAEGPLSNGVIQATRITFKESVRIEATATKAGNSLTFAGLEGISITVHPEFARGTDLSQINSGNQVKVRARQGAAGLVATRLEKTGDNPGDRTLIQGPVSSFSAAANTVTILETVEVDTSTIKNEDFKNHEQPIGRSVFFQTLQVNDIVKARHDKGAWDQIEFQD
jgi:hypothetical protein